MKAIFLIKLLLSSTLLLTLTGNAYALNCNSNNLSSKEAIQCGVSGASGTNDTARSSSDRAENFIASLINVASVAIAVIAVIMIIYGGFRYVTSAGNESSITAAKNTIIYAVIGLVIVAVAQVVVNFVLSNLSSQTNSTNTKPPATDTDGAGRRGGR